MRSATDTCNSFWQQPSVHCIVGFLELYSCDASFLFFADPCVTLATSSCCSRHRVREQLNRLLRQGADAILRPPKKEETKKKKVLQVP